MKKFLILILTVSTLLTGCGKRQPAVPIDTDSAAKYLDAIWDSAVLDEENHTAKLYLPENLSASFFSIDVTGTLRGTKNKVDLMKGKTIEPGTWLVLDNLGPYSMVNVGMDIHNPNGDTMCALAGDILNINDH